MGRIPDYRVAQWFGNHRPKTAIVFGYHRHKRSPLDRGDLLAERREQEEVHLQSLMQALPGLPRQDIALMAQDVTGLEAVLRLGTRLSASD